MKSKIASAIAFAATVCAALTFTACSDGDVDTAPANVATPTANGTLPTETCLFASTPRPGVEYVQVKKFKTIKGVYGSTSEVIPKAVAQIKMKGGNAAIMFKAGQAFSIFPWRFITPKATGTAIFITNTNGMSCQEMGGQTPEWYMNH